MGRAIGGVVAAFVLWTVLWLGFNAAAPAALPEIIDPEQPLTHAGVLLGLIAYSVVISIVAGERRHPDLWWNGRLDSRRVGDGIVLTACYVNSTVWNLIFGRDLCHRISALGIQTRRICQDGVNRLRIRTRIWRTSRLADRRHRLASLSGAICMVFRQRRQ